MVKKLVKMFRVIWRQKLAPKMRKVRNFEMVKSVWKVKICHSLHVIDSSLRWKPRMSLIDVVWLWKVLYKSRAIWHTLKQFHTKLQRQVRVDKVIWSSRNFWLSSSLKQVFAFKFGEIPLKLFYVGRKVILYVQGPVSNARWNKLIKYALNVSYK